MKVNKLKAKKISAKKKPEPQKKKPEPQQKKAESKVFDRCEVCTYFIALSKDESICIRNPPLLLPAEYAIKEKTSVETGLPVRRMEITRTMRTYVQTLPNSLCGEFKK